MSWSKGGKLEEVEKAMDEVRDEMAKQVAGPALIHSQNDVSVAFAAVRRAAAQGRKGTFSVSGHRNDDGSGSVDVHISYEREAPPAT